MLFGDIYTYVVSIKIGTAPGLLPFLLLLSRFSRVQLTDTHQIQIKVTTVVEDKWEDI